MTGDETRAALRDCKRIVVKIGSRALCADGGRYGLVAEQVATQVKAGRRVVLVSSGAVAVGRERLGFTERPKNIARLQAAAAAGYSFSQLLDHLLELALLRAGRREAVAARQ